MQQEAALAQGGATRLQLNVEGLQVCFVWTVCDLRVDVFFGDRKILKQHNLTIR